MILSLGSINADFQVRTAQPPVANAATLASDFVRLGGGKAANVAVLAQRLGHRTVLLGRVGDDDLREQALAPLRRAGVTLEHVGTATATPTAVSMIAVAPSGKKTIVLALNANDAWDAAARRNVVAAIEAAPRDAVLVADCEIDAATVADALHAAHARGLPIVLDPAPADRVDRSLLPLCAALSPDASEAAQLTGADTATVPGAARAAAQLAEHGVPLVCVKLGDGGCVFTDGGRTGHIPPVPIQVVDSTGAGDAFTGALAVALSERHTAPGAVAFATAASHLAVTRYGSQESYPARDAIEPMRQRLMAGLRWLGPCN